MRAASLSIALSLAMASAAGLPASAQDAPTAPATSTAQEGAPTPSRWFPATGADLLALIDGCESDACMSYVSGALSGLSMRTVLMGGPNPFCPTDDLIQTEDMRDALVRTIGADPNLQEGPAAMAIVATFSTIWPCAGTATDTMTDTPGATDAAAPGTTTTDEAPTMIGAIPLDSLVALAPGTTATLIQDTPNTLVLGEPGMDLSRTLVVYHDANCIHCAAFKTETNALVEQGWRVIVVPVGMTGEDAHGYAALMVAFAATRPDAVEALYRGAAVGEATVAKGLAILEEQGITAPDALSAISTTNAYDTVTRANETLLRMGGKGTPTWILSDMLATGGASATDIAALSEALATVDASTADAGAPAPLVIETPPTPDTPDSDATDGKNTAPEAP